MIFFLFGIDRCRPCYLEQVFGWMESELFRGQGTSVVLVRVIRP
jgi:hypothetical protein